MSKSKDKRPIPLTVRQSITWRIPIDLLLALDAHREPGGLRDGKERTALVVEAIELYLASLNAARRGARDRQLRRVVGRLGVVERRAAAAAARVDARAREAAL